MLSKQISEILLLVVVQVWRLIEDCVYVYFFIFRVFYYSGELIYNELVERIVAKFIILLLYAR